MKINLVGQTFGRLTVLENVGKYKGHHTLWRCKCECGNIKDVPTTSLRAGLTQSCGCIVKENKIEMIGKKFNALTVLSEVGPGKNRSIVYKCQCDCGNLLEVNGGYIRNGTVKQCRECVINTQAESRKLPDGIAARNMKFYNYKNSATDRGFVFELTLDDFIKLTQSNCFYCGRKPANVAGKNNGYNGTYIYNGIDRLNNEIGYIVENCVPACEICNKAKNNRTQEEFRSWMYDLIRFQLSKLYFDFITKEEFLT